jgi:hypothetical protein
VAHFPAACSGAGGLVGAVRNASDQ